MKKSKATQYRRAKALVGNGMSVDDACRAAGISTPTFYARRRKEGTTADVAVETAACAGTVEPSLEEQVIASDLTAKAKVRILSTLLGS